MTIFTGDPREDLIAIARINTAYAQSRILQSAVELGVFEALGKEAMPKPELCSKLGLDVDLGRDFLEALVAMGLLEQGKSGVWNSSPTSAHLIRGGVFYLGGFVNAASRRHLPLWMDLTEALQGRAKSARGSKAFSDAYQDLEAARSFLAHMDAAHSMVGPQLAEIIDWSRRRSFVDVGGARGNVAAQLATAHSHLEGAVFELPAIKPLFDEHIGSLDLAGRVTFHGGDFFADPLPRADVLIMGHVLHDWPADRRRELLGKAHSALQPGGLIMIYDQMLDREEPELHSLIGSMNVALVAGGSEYSISEGIDLVRAAGFAIQQVTPIRTVGNDVVIVAEKA